VDEKSDSGTRAAPTRLDPAEVAQLIDRIDRADTLLDSLNNRINTLVHLLDILNKRVDRLEAKAGS
jgi:ubiquinone biosynthesis protein UbiJ